MKRYVILIWTMLGDVFIFLSATYFDFYVVLFIILLNRTIVLIYNERRNKEYRELHQGHSILNIAASKGKSSRINLVMNLVLEVLFISM